MGNFISELRRRNVLRVAAFYAAAGWLLVQVATQVFPFFNISNEVVRWVVIAIALGFPVALILSWVYELTPQGLKLESEIRTDEAVHREGAHRLDRWIIVVLTLAVVVLLAGLLWKRAPEPAQAAAAAPGKSIAVLPFENLSDDKSNAWFAQGMQDEILTRLAKVGELKVISRSSTQHYGSSPDNLPEVARQLGVANILEGSVQRAGDKVHVNVQLIEAATGQHLWADIYDRKLDDVFGVEGEVAQAIASALQTRLNGGEQQAMVQRPTDNPAAYEAYLRGLGDEMRAFNAFDMDELHQTESDYAEAVRLDPNYAQAWARLSIVRSYIFVNLSDASAGPVLAQAKEAADTALKLRPDLGEGYLAQGYYHYRGLSDFDGGLDWFNKALQRLPNNADVLAAIAYIERRQGKWAESTAHLEQATSLDPRNTSTLSGLVLNYQQQRQYHKALDVADRALAVAPLDLDLAVGKAKVYIAMGDYDAATRLLDPIPYQPAQLGVYMIKVQLLMTQRRYAEALARLDTLAADKTLPADRKPAVALFIGLAHILDGHADAAQAPCRDGLKQLQAQPGFAATDDGQATGAGLHLCLGEHAESIRLAQHSADMVAKDALARPGTQLILALSLNFAGDHDGALALLDKLVQEPGGASIDDLRRPWWDSLRQDPRFQKLEASLQAQSR